MVLKAPTRPTSGDVFSSAQYCYLPGGPAVRVKYDGTRETHSRLTTCFSENSSNFSWQPGKGDGLASAVGCAVLAHCVTGCCRLKETWLQVIWGRSGGQRSIWNQREKGNCRVVCHCS